MAVSVVTAAAVGDAGRIVGDGVGTGLADGETVGAGEHAIAAAAMSESKGTRRTVGFIRLQTPETACWLRGS